MAGGRAAFLPVAGRGGGQLRGRRTGRRPPAPDAQGRARRHPRRGGMTQFVRGALTPRAPERRQDRLPHLLAGNGVADLRRHRHLPRRRTGGHRRLDPAEGGHCDEDGAQHAHDGGDGAPRQDLRQPHGRRRRRLRKGARSGAPHHHHRHRTRPRGGGSSPESGALEREGGPSSWPTPRSATPESLARLKQANDSVRAAIGEERRRAVAQARSSPR